MFTLSKHPALIASVTPIAEKHGDETVLAASLKIECTVHKLVLDQFGLKKLREALYRKPEAGEQQDLPIEGQDGNTALAFPTLSSMRIDEEFPGYTAAMFSGLDLGDPINLEEATIKKVTFDPLEGGSVKIGFMLHAHPDAATIGRLCDLLQDTVDLTLDPPTAEAQKKAA